MQIAIVDDRAEDRAELSESCRPGQFSTCLYGHLYGEHGWNGDAKLKRFYNECWGVLKKAYFQHSFCCNKIHL